MMRYLIVGSGGREHAIAWKLAHESATEEVIVVPGNAGMQTARPENENIRCEHVPENELADYCIEQRVDLVVVGPEAPLCRGLADSLRAAGVKCFGPSQRAAQLEASKSFAKRVMTEADVATAAFATFDNATSAIAYAQAHWPVVIKADGLAGGKGVSLPETIDEAEQTIQEFIDGRFGDASKSIVIEERMSGPEVSVMVITDGTNCVFLPTSRDHKRLLDGDNGPNTGGMGAISPAPGVDDQTLDKMKQTMRAVIAQMKENHGGFVGFLYGGFMLTADGPKVLEFNVRLGDPETQALMLAINEHEIGPLLLRAATEGLTDDVLTGKPSACVVLASEGYPEKPIVDRVITLQKPPANTNVFFAGVKRYRDELLTSGGRVLSTCASAESIELALESAYAAAKSIRFEGKQFRTDVGR